MDQENREDKLMNDIEVSEYLNISVVTLRKWRNKSNKNGKIPFIKVGKKLVRYRQSDIDEFLKQNTKVG